MSGGSVGQETDGRSPAAPASAAIGDHPGIGPGTRFAILTGGDLLEVTGKMAHGVLRFRPEAAAVVIDQRFAGRTADELVPGVVARVPIVASLEEAFGHRPTALLLGTTPAGGLLPEAWRPTIAAAIRAGLTIVGGMHAFLSEDAEFAGLAGERGVHLVDLRRPPEQVRLSSGRVLDLAATRIVLTVGSDAAIGKMSTALSLDRALRQRGETSAFVATGQTGIAIAGWGVAIDRVIGDFMAGVAEDLVLRAAAGSRCVVVEGQGSIAHPAFSSVTLALIHGTAPTDLILCHDERRRQVIDYERMTVPSLDRLIRTYEDLTTYMRPARVRAVALNTAGMTAAKAEAAVARVERETGLPCVDAIRSGGARLVDAILAPDVAPHALS